MLNQKFVTNLELSVLANMTCILLIMTRKYMQTNKHTEIDIQIISFLSSYTVTNLSGTMANTVQH